MVRLPGRAPQNSVVVASFLCAALLGACGTHEVRQTAGPERRALANPTTVALYRGSRVVGAVPVDSSKVFAAMKASDPHADLPKNFRGHEVIAETSASMHDLNVWLDGMKKAPPRGLRRASTGGRSDVSNDRSTLSSVSFESANGERSVFVVAADPHKVRQQLGPLFALIENYHAVPGVVRGPIDDQAKKQFGYSVSEMLDENSPAGAVLAALKRLEAENRRGILVIDETRAR